jgi:hypothetical protein
MITKTTSVSFDYKAAALKILKNLKRDRDRQVIAKRFGFDLEKRQTLERIGKTFGITRERVRQIEKATIVKLRTVAKNDIVTAAVEIKTVLEENGHVMSLEDLSARFGAIKPGQQAYVQFLATLSPDLEVTEEDDDLHTTIGLADWNKTAINAVAKQLVATIKAHGRVVSTGKLADLAGLEHDKVTLSHIAGVTKALATLDGKWGLINWPAVNPKNIRDKTYLILGKHGLPLHFSDIAQHIQAAEFSKRSVTVQAVHNELIKDGRFVLIGRGIYALAEWGYAPGTVADIIAEVLTEAAEPLHKDEIINKVLAKRQVKTTTIILNLQEKPQFIRVAKATYKLADS